MTTTMATSIGAEPSGSAAIAARDAGAGFLTTTGQTARRTALQYVRTPQLLILPAVMGGLFLFIFRYVFGGAIHPGGGVDYVDFLVPGYLATIILFTGMNAPAGVAEDAASGVHDRLRSLPIPRAAAVAGRSLADTAMIAWTLAVSASLGVLVGFRTHGSPGAALLAVVLMLLASYAFSWVFIALGLTAGNAQAAQGMASLVVVPFTFLSSAYVPVHSMPGWMQPFAANQPVTAMINAVRSLMLGGAEAAGVGHSTLHWVVLAAAWSVGILALFSAIAVRRFGRTR